MNEIPGSPMSRQDFAVVFKELILAKHNWFPVREILVSSRRVKQPFKAYGVPVRPTHSLKLNDGVLVGDDREPWHFSFEES